jgi:hypothetical protein
MNDLPSSPAAAALFELLGSLAGLRNNPEAIKNLTPGDQEWLDESLKDYRINAINLAEKFVEPLRKNAPANAEDIYDLIRRLMYTSFLIGATLVFSDSTHAFLQPGIINDHKKSAAAKMREVRAKNPKKEAQKLAEKTAVSECMRGKTTGKPFSKARLILSEVNKKLTDSQFKPVSKSTVGRILRENHFPLED